jgi:hypothetical protein
LVLPVFNVTGQNADGSQISFKLDVTVVDDLPVSITPTSVDMVDQATASAGITEPLNFVPGADGIGTVNFTFTDGTQALEPDGHVLTYNNLPLYLHYGQTNGVIDPTILVATTTSGTFANGVSTAGSDVGYWIQLNPSSNTYTLHTVGLISNGTAVTATDLSSVGGGNNATKAIVDIGGTTQDVLLTTASGNTVNTNHTEIGIGTGQSFTVGEGVRFDFVNGTVTGQGGNQLYTPDGTHNETNSFQNIINLTAGASSADIKVTAIEANSDLNFWGDPNDHAVAINAVHVYSGTLAQVNAGTATDVTSQVTITYNPDGSANIQGLHDGWIYQIQTTGHTFNAVEVDYLGTTTGHDFKLGVFSYGTNSPGDPIDLSYNVTGYDGDGDPVSGTLHANLFPPSLTYVGLSGGGTVDHHTDTSTHYYLGTDANDTFIAGSGNDILVGGDGTNTLTGGGGSDTFVLSYNGYDNITDFNKSSGGDVLDITDVLAGAHITPAAFDAKPSDYLIADTTSSPGNTIIDIQAPGAAIHPVATLQGVSLSSADVSTLLSQHQIVHGT